jgi:predicted amidohydrolase YtcJ
MKMFSGGTILTMESAHPRADALAVDGSRIVAVGDESAVRAAAPGADIVDLAGTCLLPGFIDAHHHFSEGALLTSRLDLHWPAVKSVDEILMQLRTLTSEIPEGEWIIGEGYDEQRLQEGTRPTLAQLDDVCPKHPVILLQYSWHEVVVNSRAHEVLDLPLRRPDPPGGEIGYTLRGQPTGHMVENAMAPFYMAAITPLVERDEEGYFSALEQYQSRLFHAGITRVYDAAVSPLMARTLKRASDRGVLRIPVLMMSSSEKGMFMPPIDRLIPNEPGTAADLLLAGPLQVFMDGGIRLAQSMPLHEIPAFSLNMLTSAVRRRTLSRILALPTPRLDLAGWCARTGILFYTEREAQELINKATHCGLSVAVHALGNDAIDRTLRVLPKSRQDRSPGITPNRLEHFFFPGRDAIERAQELDLAIAVQPTIFASTGDGILDMGLRLPFMPLRDMLDAGLTVAGSSDAPVVDFDPLVGIRVAVTRRTEEGRDFNDGQNVTIAEALERYTVHAARAGGLDEEVGSLVPGKRADLVVLNEDPTVLAASDLGRLTVQRTISGGKDVFVA